jgi:hypothetical protein
MSRIVAIFMPLWPITRVVSLWLCEDKNTTIFLQYPISRLMCDGMVLKVVQISDQHQQINKNVVFHSVGLVEEYVLFTLDSSNKLEALQKIIGEMAIIGVRITQPKSNTEHVLRQNDAINMTTGLQLYISSNTLRVRHRAFKQIIGQPISDDNEWLRGQLSSLSNVAEPAAQPHQRLQLHMRSKFDYDDIV